MLRRLWSRRYAQRYRVLPHPSICMQYSLSSVLYVIMATSTPPIAPARPHEVVTPNGTRRDDPYAWLRDDAGRDREVIKYLEDENYYGKHLLAANRKLENRLFDDMASRVPRLEAVPATPSRSLSYWYGSTRGPGQDYWVHIRRPGMTKLQGPPNPLSYGPNLDTQQQVVLDINDLAHGIKYCDVGAVKPSPDGRYVAFTVDTVGDEKYELVIREIGSRRCVSFAGADASSGMGGLKGCAAAVHWSPDSSAVFAMMLTLRTKEACKVVRCSLAGEKGARRQEPELILQDDTSGAVLEMVGPTSCGQFLMFFRKAEGYRALLALTLRPARGSRTSRSVTQPTRGVPAGVQLYGDDPWVIITPESSAVSVLRADHLYNDDGRGGSGHRRETFVVLGDTDRFPDGHVFAVTDGKIRRRTVLVPGKRGLQVVDTAVCGVVSAAATTNGAVAAGANRQYLVVHVLENMRAVVHVYDLSAVKQAVVAKRTDMKKLRQQRRQRPVGGHVNDEDVKRGVAVARADLDSSDVVADGHQGHHDMDGDDDDDETEDDDDAEGEAPDGHLHSHAMAAHHLQTQATAGPPVGRLPLLWTYSPGDAISSLHLEHGCWPGSMPYIRLSYSNLTTPTMTVDLDLAAQRAYVRQVEQVEDFKEGRYTSRTLWATSADGTRVPATISCRTDVWPPTTGRPLPVIVQAYGAYARKLLPDFIPGDLAILDGGAGGAVEAGAAAAADGGCGPCLMVLAHARGGGELGTHWHSEGRSDRKINTAEDVAAVVRMLVDEGYARREAVALWGRSAGGLAVGMTLERCPPGTFRTAVLDVPFLDVLGAMTDTSLPLTIKEQPEWGDPASSQEDYDYILSYSPYDNVEKLAEATPAMVVTCSLYDPRVPYWGPAKFVVRLRAAMASAKAAGGASGGPVVLLTELEAGGHFSVSGASGKLSERSMRVAFLMRELRRGMDLTAEEPAAALRPSQPTV